MLPSIRRATIVLRAMDRDIARRHPASVFTRMSAVWNVVTVQINLF